MPSTIPPPGATRSALARFARRLRLPRNMRSLAGDMFLVHLTFATFVGVLAASGMWQTSRWMIEENLRKWAVQWVTQLDELGTPLYVAPDRHEFARVSDYVQTVPEIAYVRYYTADGDLLHAQTTEAARKYREPPLLTTEELDDLRQRTTQDRPYLLDDSIHPGRLFQATTCLWAESILSDGLLGFDPEGAADQRKSLLGYVELGLDFGRYEARVTRNILIVSLIIAIILLALAVAGRLSIQRAIKPLTQLQEPLTKLALGELEVAVDQSGHSEIVAINNALVSTIHALQERDQKLRQLANFDPLTGLMSRQYFTEEVAQELQRLAPGETSALMFVDLDQFKYVNDTLGHRAGDQLLVRAAASLKETISSRDIISRLGGDEFAVLARGVTRAEADDLALSLVESTRPVHFLEGGRPFHVNCSVGVTMIQPGEAAPDEIIAQADMACHEAKSRGRNRHQFYKMSGEDREKLETDTGWSRRIRRALQKNEFSLRYQPIVDVATGEPVLWEVLLRMKGDGRKVISPGSFLPAATRFGLMVDVDYWVIRNALQALREFRAKDPDLTLTMNLSGLVFSEPSFADYVREHLEANDLPATAVVFEVTEQVAIRYVAEANKVMRELKEMGCGFALDDFGAGFSSFNYLKQLPMDYLKIDGSFIEHMATDDTDQAMVRSIVQIAQAVGMRTVAEYVRDEHTLALLSELGVDYAQGYYIGRPRKTVSSPSPRRHPKSVGV